MQGASQDVGISSTPTAASVTIDNAERGKTPMVATLRRKDNHVVKIELPGYLPYETTITRSTSGWVWGNIVFGGLIGLAVDAISGGLYKLKPDQVAGVLSKQNAEIRKIDDIIYVIVTLNPDPAWEKVGDLKVLQ
ncbi:MAG: PEGA domain-containing protein [candidate division Zixibacteria bacterium]|nr:PEGA domain-containing protein [candidate division Zixibacteria bacterium]